MRGHLLRTATGRGRYATPSQLTDRHLSTHGAEQLLCDPFPSQRKLLTLRVRRDPAATSRIIRTEHPHPSDVVIRVILGALPDSLAYNFVDARGEVGFVPEYVSVWVVANGGRWVALEAVLAREVVVGAEGALLLAPGVTIGLGHTKRCKTHANKFRQTERRWKVRLEARSSPVRGCTSKTSHKTGVRTVEAKT